MKRAVVVIVKTAVALLRINQTAFCFNDLTATGAVSRKVSSSGSFHTNPTVGRVLSCSLDSCSQRFRLLLPPANLSMSSGRTYASVNDDLLEMDNVDLRAIQKVLLSMGKTYRAPSVRQGYCMQLLPNGGVVLCSATTDPDRLPSFSEVNKVPAALAGEQPSDKMAPPLRAPKPPSEHDGNYLLSNSDEYLQLSVAGKVIKYRYEEIDFPPIDDISSSDGLMIFEDEQMDESAHDLKLQTSRSCVDIRTMLDSITPKRRSSRTFQWMSHSNLSVLRGSPGIEDTSRARDSHKPTAAARVDKPVHPLPFAPMLSTKTIKVISPQRYKPSTQVTSEHRTSGSGTPIR